MSFLALLALLDLASDKEQNISAAYQNQFAKAVAMSGIHMGC